MKNSFDKLDWRLRYILAEAGMIVFVFSISYFLPFNLPFIGRNSQVSFFGVMVVFQGFDLKMSFEQWKKVTSK